MSIPQPQRHRAAATAASVGLPLEQGQDGIGSEAIPPHLIPTLARYAALKQLQEYFDSKQYAGRPDFWTGIKGTGGEPVPLRERAPCINYPLAKNAVRQTVRFMLGEGRWPALRVEHGEGDEGAEAPEPDGEEEDGADLGLSEAEAETLKAGLDELVEKSGLPTVFRRLVERGLATGTSVGVFTIRRGRFSVELPHARDCWPTFESDDPTLGVIRLTWAYRYRKQVPEGDQLVTKTFWFRRDFDAEATLIYPPVEETTDGKTPQWAAPRAEPHGLGFCPVLWFRNGDHGNADVDGVSLYDGLLNELDAVNLALSQRHRGIHYHGSPQPWETGVEPGDGPEATGRKAGSFSPDDTAGRQSHGKVSEKARKQGPDKMWSYQGDNVKVGLLEATGSTFDATSKHVEDVRGRALEAMGVVIFNAEATMQLGGSDMSAKLLRLIYAPLLALVADLRTATWGPALTACLGLMVRMIVALDGRGIRLRHAKRLAQLGKRFLVSTASAVEGEGPSDVWTFPELELVWGPSFESSPADVSGGIEGAVKASTGGLIAQKTAAGYVAPFFGVKDTVAELKAVEKERAKTQADAVKNEAARTAAVAAATPQPPAPQPPNEGPPA
jgi:hypothetical protein